MKKLYFRYGVMSSGKTTQLLQVVYNYEQKNMKCIVAKPLVDTKGDDTIVSRLGVSRKVDLLISNDMDLFKYIQKELEKEELECFVIDEAQFLTSKQVFELLEIAIKLNVAVMCYGLKSDFLLNPFEGSSKLMTIAQDIEEIKQICSCGRKATINIRKNNGKVCFAGEQVVIDNDANIEYEAICASCYFKLLEEHQKELEKMQ